MTTTATPTTYTITAAEMKLLDAARELSKFYKLNGNGCKWTVADYIAERLHGSLKPWNAFEKALDAMRAAEAPCANCAGTGEVPAVESILPDSCTPCDGRGWIL